MAGITDLGQLLRHLEPTARDGEFVYVNMPGPRLPATLSPEATICENEGLTAILRRADADAASLAYDVTLAWITLSVPSSLEAVGLTAAFSTALGRAGISCNVLAGFHHDHLLVPVPQRDAALAVLRALAAGKGR